MEFIFNIALIVIVSNARFLTALDGEGENCEKDCHFPFVYNEQSYNKCAVDGNAGIPFCVTNQTVFDAIDVFDCNELRGGCKYCQNKNCSIEKYCPNCEATYFYQGKTYSYCTYDGDQTNDENGKDNGVIETLPWCITNSTAFISDEAIGWEYCSEQCAPSDMDKDNVLVVKETWFIIIIPILPILPLCLVAIYFKRKMSELNRARSRISNNMLPMK